MPPRSKHDQVADRLASQYGTTYNKGQGADIQTPQIAIEVETANTVGDASRQLAGHNKPSFVAAADQKALERALDHYGDTTIGVMDEYGIVRKDSTRGR